MHRTVALRAVFLATLLGALGAGCARVKPWEREQLAGKTMAFEADGQETGLELALRKTKVSGTLGMGTTSGAGCGCN
jgi:hypothetical protein